MTQTRAWLVPLVLLLVGCATPERAKRIKPWWFTTDAGKLALHVRYGSRVLELAKGKFAVEVPSERDIAPTLDLIKAAVLAGELDAAMDAASVKLREGFHK